ncbi:MAG: ribonuclease Z [Marinilabiliaceae bacterium]|nr:ribonuclease Z [Marinilabiliaceae bacterium]
MELTVLGCNSAKPTSNRHPSAQVLSVANHMFLIDCAEGTQFQLHQMHVNFMRIDYILISHLHGDHVLGLVGLLSTMSLLHRSTPLTIIADPQLETIVRSQINFFCENISFEINFIHIHFELPQIVLNIKGVSVQSVPLRHRVPTCGFVVREQPKEPNIRKNAIYKYGLTIADIVNIKNGKAWTDPVTGECVNRKELVIDPPKPKSYAYISDTAYKPDIVPYIEGVSLLYHESTFASDKEDMAKITYHSTAQQAATIAQRANVGKLLLGHYSSRYKETDIFEAEAQNIFPNSTAVYDGYKLVF